MPNIISHRRQALVALLQLHYLLSSELPKFLLVRTMTASMWIKSEKPAGFASYKWTHSPAPPHPQTSPEILPSPTPIPTSVKDTPKPAPRPRTICLSDIQGEHEDATTRLLKHRKPPTGRFLSKSERNAQFAAHAKQMSKKRNAEVLDEAEDTQHQQRTRRGGISLSQNLVHYGLGTRNKSPNPIHLYKYRLHQSS